jgi:Zn finger protein HypA/HybF (possibly regulating hydrogenase expression)
VHELALMESVLEIVLDSAKEHNAGKITQIHLTVGTLTNIIPKWADQFFAMIAKGTVAEGAELFFEVLPARTLCRKCGGETSFMSDNMLFHCDRCNSEEITLVSGKEFSVRHIEAIVGNQALEDASHG